MPLIAQETSGKTFDPVSEGVHIAGCYGVVDLGTHTDEYKGTTRDRHEVVFLYEIPDERIDLDRDGETVNLPRAISRRMTLSLSEKSNMRPYLESWRGKKFTRDELGGFDLSRLPGAFCQLQVLHNVSASNGRTYANIASIMPLPKGQTPPPLENDVQFYSIADHGTDIPENIPDWMCEIIRESHEWAELAGNGAATVADAAPDFTDSDDESLPF